MRLTASLLLLCLMLSCGSSEKGDSGKGKSGSSDDKPKAAGAGANKNSVTIEGKAQKLADVRTEEVRTTSVFEYLTAAGQVMSNEERSAHVGSYTDGRITQIHANVGDLVERGSVLARMHSHDVHETRAAYETALEGVTRRQNALAYQQRLRDRMARLYQLKSASRQEVEKAEADVRDAQADLADAHIAVQKEVAHLTDILHLPASSLNHINEETEQVPVIAPMSGTVLDRKITMGSVVEPGQEVFTISDLRSVWAMASVNESDIAKVRVGDRARIVSQAFPDQSFAGGVTRIGTELDPRTRTLQVRILVPNPRQQLRIAMYVNVQIQSGRSRQAIFLPEAAVQQINGGSVVFLRQEGRLFEARPVDIANRIGGQAEIRSGLKPGDAVVVKGSFVVKSEMLKSQIGE